MSGNTMRLLPHDSELAWTPYVCLIYVVPFLLTPLYYSPYASTGGWGMHIVVTLVFLGLYFRSFWVRGRELVIVASLTALLGVMFWPLSYGAGCFFIYAASMLGQLEPTRRAYRGVVAITAIAGIEALFLERDIGSRIWPALFSLIIGGINAHFSQVGRSNARLRLAREEIEHLAKLAERERIARDLHDLLGHTLSLVILKAELAAKLSEREPERSRLEIGDVERIAREALAEVRAAVTGYRSGGLVAELHHARSALASAGVAFVAEAPTIAIPPAQEAVLCLAMREAVTNIVRHAGARTCRMTLSADDSTCSLTVSDDGRGGNQPFGSGLTGMRERVEILGGILTRAGDGGTTLVVTLPLARVSFEEQSA